MIYLDNASTTKLSDEGKNQINKSHDFFWNPSALYGKGLEVKRLIIEAKKEICGALGTSYSDNLIFTASATESNNLAIFGSIKKTKEQLIFSQGEHPSVYNCALELKARGYEVRFIPLTDSGEVDILAFKKLLEKPTAFVSIMHVNNETGAINDIKKLVTLTKKKYPNATFHCDGVQAFGKIPVNVTSLGVDFYTVSGHKIHAPKGIGALYGKNFKKLKPIIFGGGQELGLRSGTENTQYILAFAEVVKNFKIKENFNKVIEINKYVKDFFAREKIASLNSSKNTSPYILSYSFEKVRGETLVRMLEEEGIIIGTGSACSSKKGGLNRTLEAMGKSKEQNQGAVRISFSGKSSLEEVKIATEIILKTYKKLLDKVV